MPSRRSQIAMDEAEIRAFLAAQRTIILTSNQRSGFPHPMPMWFALDADGTVRMTTFRKSQKVLNLRRDPRCSLLTEDGEVYNELRGVLIYSRAEVIDDEEAAIDTMLQLAGNEPDDAQAREAVRPIARKRVVVRCPPERVISWDHRKLGGRY